jgi:hypothetical protein
MSLKRAAVLAAIGVLIYSSFNFTRVSSAAEKSHFTDISSGYWGAAAIQWAYDNQVVTGYPDGSFKPEQKVSQSEFLAMLIRTYQPADLINDPTEEWDSSYNRYALMNGWLKNGWMAGDPPIDPSVESRGKVAKLLTNASGRNYNINDSIQYLLDSGLSQGQTEKSIKGYNKDANLNRAEAVTFIKNVKSKLEMLYRSPLKEEVYNKISLKLTPAENWKLVIAQDEEAPEISYSIMSFSSPSQGYTEVNQTEFPIQGKLLKQNGKGLTIGIEKKQENGFVKVGTKEALFTNEAIDSSIELNDGEGLYRIVIYTDADVHHSVGEAPITMFYIDYERTEV